jgi:hypothetical protein
MQMARVRGLFWILFVVLLLSGCAAPAGDTAGKIIAPVNIVSPLEGKWVVTADLRVDATHTSNKVWKGKMAQFTQDAASLGDYVWHTPTFKIKKVNSQAYLLAKYVSMPVDLVFNSSEVEVVTVSTADNFLGEFMKIDDRHAVAFVQNNALYLEKVLDTVDPSLNTKVSVPGKTTPVKTEVGGVSGVLLGLKTPGKSDGKSDSSYSYRTLWIATDNGQLHPVLEGKDIFIPRQSGFWQLKVRRAQDGNKVEDVIFAYDISTKDPEMQPLKLNAARWLNKEGTLARSIDYISNDYVTVENNGSGTLIAEGSAWNDQRLQVLPLDNIAGLEGIKISELVGDNSSLVFKSARDQVQQAIVNGDSKEIGTGDAEQNFGLVRKNAHWFFQGRINYSSADKPGYVDFNVNIVPPTKLVSYDTLYLSWQNIKDRVPEAVDAYTSPNGDVAIVVAKGQLYVYTLKGGKLDGEPLTKLKLNEGETVVMSDWATTGLYVDNWEKSFSANGAAEI